VIYEVKAADGRSVRVEAVDWMMAMGQAIALLDISVSGWMCDTLPDGAVSVMDPMSGETWRVTPIAEPPPARAGSGSVAGGPPAWGATLPAAAPPPPSLPRMPRLSASPANPKSPLVSTLAEGFAKREEPVATAAPADLAERLFDLSTDLYGADSGRAACRQALDILMQLVPCEAGSVLTGTRDHGELTFVAAAGPAAAKILGQKMHFGRGVVGASFDLGITILVQDVTRDDRHLPRFDEQTGFTTRSVLCVPLRQENAVFGALELINATVSHDRASPARFQAWHVEAMEAVALPLASILANEA
jgi:putative methionine-R-sulfoxide reductase with GAF domain